MKRAVLAGMIVLCALGWYVTGKDMISRPMAYSRLMKQAEQYEKDKIYIRAIETYKEALEYKPESIEIQSRIAEDYLSLGDESSFINRCNSINSTYNYPISVVTRLADYYMENNRNDNAITLLTKARRVHEGNPDLAERYEKLRYTYKEVYVSYDEIWPMRNDSAVIVEEGRYGLIKPSGKAILRCANEAVLPLSNDRTQIPVKQEGETFFANNDGYRIEVPKEGRPVEALGVLCNGKAPAMIGGAYGYVDGQFNELTSFEWEDATVIQSGFGAVKKEGKWALINENLEVFTDYIYEDVKRDVYGYCSISGRVFAGRQGEYRLYNEKGEPVGDGVFEDAVPFVSQEPTAVKKDGKWGFIDLDGHMVIEPQYESAEGFNEGLAPVETLNGWGYITQDNRMVIADEFKGAHYFYKGYAPVKTGNSWSVIERNVKEGNA